MACNGDDVVVVKIDAWFEIKWLGFSHKVQGAFGLSVLDDLVVPPFVPNRVVSERSYKRAGSGFAEAAGGPRLHVDEPSEANARRKLRDSHPSAALFWWTGNTRASGRGALMAYLPTADGHTGWYTGLKRDGGWGFVDLHGVGVAQLRALEAGVADPVASGDGAGPLR